MRSAMTLARPQRLPKKRGLTTIGSFGHILIIKNNECSQKRPIYLNHKQKVSFDIYIGISDKCIHI